METEPESLSEENALATVMRLPDPEIPVLTLGDLGVIRSLHVDGDSVEVGVAPTYSGCPATEFIEQSVVDALIAQGFSDVVTRRVLSPPWTTDWITQRGRNALAKYGIAPPLNATADKAALTGEKRLVRCTLCGSMNTKVVSPFGSTPCKALFQCQDCNEPFDYFKCLK